MNDLARLRLYRHGVRALLLLTVVAGPSLESAFGGPVTDFAGKATGIFTNPVGGVTTGTGTSTFTWGTGNPSILRFSGKTFTVRTPTGFIYGTAAQESRPTFSLGTLTYYNGTIAGGSGASAVRLDASVQLTAPVMTGNTVVPSSLNLINTTNTDDPIASADQVFLPKDLLPVTVSTVGGAKISIEPVGFGNVSAAGFVTTIDRFNVLEEASASADFLAKIASPCEPIVRRGTSTTASGKTMRASFTPNYSLTLQQAAQLCGYDHFNWLQLVTVAPYPPPGITVPFIDPPIGGGTAFGGCADDLPFYWDERICPPTGYDLPSNTSNLALDFQDTPVQPRLKGREYVAFTTSLVGVNSDSTYEVLYTFTWKSNNKGSSGRVFFRVRAEDADLGGEGGIFDVQTDLSPWEVPASVRAVWTSTGATNADNGITFFLPGDVNGDRIVDCRDLASIKAAFGKSSTQPGYSRVLDIDNSGVIDARDLAIAARALPANTVCN